MNGASAFTLAGTVYGTLMNFRSEHEALGEAMNAAPYKAPPRTPVLYVKPANTWRADGEALAVPAGTPEIEVGATLGLVTGAAGQPVGCVLVNDLCLPHTSFFRPAIRQRCFDGSLAAGTRVAAVDPAAVRIEVLVNGEVRQVVAFDRLVRDAATLWADVAEFMTLDPGDVLLLGCEAQRPRVRAGDVVQLRASGLGTLTNPLVGAPA